MPRRERSSPPPDSPRSVEERLQKVLAAAGVGSRRQCEELILAGRIEVDGKVVDELGAKVDPACHEIRVDGQVLKRPKLVYYLLNKPPGVLCTNRDPAGRMRAVDLIPAGQRLFTVGRLDRSSEGLILITNDGELANRLAHPRYGVTKTYLVEVAGQLTLDEVRQLRQGIHLAEAYVRVVQARIRRRSKRSTTIEIVLDEGRHREIRRMLARTGHKVVRLRRVALGPLKLGELPLGAHRLLSPKEIRSAKEATRGESPRGGRKRSPAQSGGRKRSKPRRSESKSTEKPPRRSESKTTDRPPRRTGKKTTSAGTSRIEKQRRTSENRRRGKPRGKSK